MRETCARVLAAALMTGAIGFALAMPAFFATAHDAGRSLTAPPSFLQRSVHVVASAPSRSARGGRLEETQTIRPAALRVPASHWPRSGTRVAARQRQACRHPAPKPAPKPTPAPRHSYTRPRSRLTACRARNSPDHPPSTRTAKGKDKGRARITRQGQWQRPRPAARPAAPPTADARPTATPRATEAAERPRQRQRQRQRQRTRQEPRQRDTG